MNGLYHLLKKCMSCAKHESEKSKDTYKNKCNQLVVTSTTKQCLCDKDNKSGIKPGLNCVNVPEKGVIVSS